MSRDEKNLSLLSRIPRERGKVVKAFKRAAQFGRVAGRAFIKLTTKKG